MIEVAFVGRRHVLPRGPLATLQLKRQSQPFMKLLCLTAIPFLAFASVATGPEVGSRVPDFHLLDAVGHPQTLKSIMGPKGALLVFFRSADW